MAIIVKNNVAVLIHICPNLVSRHSLYIYLYKCQMSSDPYGPIFTLYIDHLVFYFPIVTFWKHFISFYTVAVDFNYEILLRIFSLVEVDKQFSTSSNSFVSWLKKRKNWNVLTIYCVYTNWSASYNLWINWKRNDKGLWYCHKKFFRLHLMIDWLLIKIKRNSYHLLVGHTKAITLSLTF